MTFQLAIRITDELAIELDNLVATGRFANRTEVVRSAISDFMARERRSSIAEAIVQGYTRFPGTADELGTAEHNLRRLVSEEPW